MCKISGFLELGMEGEMYMGLRHEKTFGVMEMFYIFLLYLLYLSFSPLNLYSILILYRILS